MKKSDPTQTGAEKALTQFAALCHRRNEAGEPEVLLITSRETGRWVLPKGWPMRGLTGSACALREAFEEAGVVGTVSDEPVGYFSYVKVIAPGDERTCVVTVFPVAVRKLRSNFPERGQRQRGWFAFEEAARMVGEPELSTLLRTFVPPGPLR